MAEPGDKEEADESDAGASSRGHGTILGKRLRMHVEEESPRAGRREGSGASAAADMAEDSHDRTGARRRSVSNSSSGSPAAKAPKTKPRLGVGYSRPLPRNGLPKQLRRLANRRHARSKSDKTLDQAPVPGLADLPDLVRPSDVTPIPPPEVC